MPSNVNGQRVKSHLKAKTAQKRDSPHQNLLFLSQADNVSTCIVNLFCFYASYSSIVRRLLRE